MTASGLSYETTVIDGVAPVVADPVAFIVAGLTALVEADLTTLELAAGAQIYVTLIADWRQAEVSAAVPSPGLHIAR